MIKEIIEAFCGELQELFKDSQVTVLRDTQFKEEDMPSHTMPLIILGLSDSPTMTQLCGGSTQSEWNWNIRAYFYDSNAELSPDQAFSTESYELIETIVKHLNFQSWLTQGFIDVENQYSFKLTFQDISKANPMDSGNGIVAGYVIQYNSIAIDTFTSFNKYSDVTLLNVRQIPFDKNTYNKLLPITNLVATPNTTSRNTLTWNDPNNSINETFVQVKRATFENMFDAIILTNTLPAGSETYVDNTAIVGTIYYYEVIVLGDGINYENSDPVQIICQTQSAITCNQIDEHISFDVDSIIIFRYLEDYQIFELIPTQGQNATLTYENDTPYILGTTVLGGNKLKLTLTNAPGGVRMKGQLL